MQRGERKRGRLLMPRGHGEGQPSLGRTKARMERGEEQHRLAAGVTPYGAGSDPVLLCTVSISHFQAFPGCFLAFPWNLCFPLPSSIIPAGDGNFIFTFVLEEDVIAPALMQEHCLLLASTCCSHRASFVTVTAAIGFFLFLIS